MKQNPYSKRPRNRPRRPLNARGGYSPNRVFESNGPDVKLRGTAAQVHEKYISLARDAQSSGDSVAAESYFQHAEHYQRLLSAMQEHNDKDGQQREQRDNARNESEANGAASGEQPRMKKQARSRDEQPSPAKESNGSGGSVKSDSEEKE